MTEGNIFHHLIAYAVPLMLGNVFQLTYNAVDSIIVGRYGGKDALAAVGTSGPVSTIIVLGVSGICMGAGVMMSNFFGQNNMKKLKSEYATTLVSGTIMALLVTALGLIFSRLILRLLQVPEEILADSGMYLRIILCGVPFTFVYNAVSYTLRSLGDSKTATRYLAITCVLNIFLDLIFVAWFRWGVAGAGVATVISQMLSAVLCMDFVRRRIPDLKLSRRDLAVDKALFKETMKYGSVTALQQSCQPIGKLLIQGVINLQGIAAMAAFNAVNRVDDFACIPEQSISHSMTTFVAQNDGAGHKERLREGFRKGIMLEAAYWVLICAVTLLFRTPIMKLFIKDDAETISIGVSYLTLMAFFYLLPGLTNGIQGFFRGMKKMDITLMGTIIQISVRVIVVFVMVPKIGLDGAAWACFAGWTCMIFAEYGYYFFWYRKKEKERLGLS